MRALRTCVISDFSVKAQGVNAVAFGPEIIAASSNPEPPECTVRLVVKATQTTDTMCKFF
jgi:hypothetical protein